MKRYNKKHKAEAVRLSDEVGVKTAAEQLAILSTDISEVPCCDRKVYISPVMDAAEGEIVAFEMRNDMKKELCIDTLKQMKARYMNLLGTILHSDRRSQYTSEAF